MSKELTPIELENNLGPDVDSVVHRVPWLAYDKDEADIYIAELKAENERLKSKVESAWNCVNLRSPSTNGQMM